MREDFWSDLTEIEAPCETLNCTEIKLSSDSRITSLTLIDEFQGSCCRPDASRERPKNTGYLEVRHFLGSAIKTEKATVVARTRRKRKKPTFPKF